METETVTQIIDRVVGKHQDGYTSKYGKMGKGPSESVIKNKTTRDFVGVKKRCIKCKDFFKLTTKVEVTKMCPDCKNAYIVANGGLFKI